MIKKIVPVLSLALLATTAFVPSAKALTYAEIAKAQSGGKVLGASTTGVGFTINNVGIATLTYNGQSYVQYPQSVADNLVGNAAFRAPDGTEKCYGWCVNTLDHDSFHLPNSTTVISTSTDGYQDIYRNGLSDSLTVKVTFIAADSQTLKIDVAVTNNDPTDTLARISMGYFEPFMVPGPINSYALNQVVQAGNPATTDYSPTIFLKGTWGSVGIWPGDYTVPTGLGTYFNSLTQTVFPISFNNFSTNQIGHNYEDPVAPGATKIYTTYFRFGSAADSSATLAPEAYNTLRQAYPYLVNWPDRRPVARIFLGNSVGNGPSATNPRGYFGDKTFDVSNQANFNTKMLSWADSMVANMDAMNPKPQGIMVWDLEGDEFYQYFTYVGSPDKLHDMAPEMDAVADQFFAKFKNAGYKIGMTLRPSNFQTGTALPATCYHDASTTELSDVFIKNDAAYPYRGYVCSATNTWTQPGANLPYYQHMSNDDAATYQILHDKVAYAKQRWGATMFYVDSTVYSKGAPFNASIFRRLQQDFPDVVFFPENENVDFVGASAPYGQVNMGDYGATQAEKDIYPNAFTMLQPFDGVDYSSSTVFNALVNSVKNGNILFVNGWFADTQNQSIDQIYQAAGISNSSSTPSTLPAIASFSASPASITSGGSSTLAWSVTGATSLSLNQGIGDVTSLTSKSVAPATSTTYTLTATNSSGTVTANATVTVSAPADTAPPVISNLQTSNLTSTGATISWATDEPATTVVNYGLTTSYGLTSSSLSLTTSHSVTLSGLSSASSYHFSVQSSDSSGNLAVSSDNSFTTAQDPTLQSPPSAITNLSASQPTKTSMKLTWTAPGSSGNSGTASSYDIRYSTSPITSSNWASAIQVTGEPAPTLAGTTQSYVIVGLAQATKYYAALTATNSQGLTSSLSNVVSFATKRNGK